MVAQSNATRDCSIQNMVNIHNYCLLNLLSNITAVLCWYCAGRHSTDICVLSPCHLIKPTHIPRLSKIIEFHCGYTNYVNQYIFVPPWRSYSLGSWVTDHFTNCSPLLHLWPSIQIRYSTEVRQAKMGMPNIITVLYVRELNQPACFFCQLCSHSRTSQQFMELKGSLLLSQELSSCPSSEPDQYTPYHHILYLQDLSLNIIYQPTSWPFYWSVSFWLFH
jgi:hypothetical protein